MVRFVYRPLCPNHPVRPRLSYHIHLGDEIVTKPGAKRSQVLSAWLCLLAAILLLAPLAGAAWSAHTAACCTGGDHCPIPQHHHSKAPQHSSDCEHQTGGMTACSMACCQNTERPLLTPLAFVLPVAASLAIPENVTAVASIVRPNTLPRSLEVLSPPPRLSNITL